MNLKRSLTVVAARSREFYRDKAGLGWNIVMPAIMVLGFAFIFSSPDESLYKVGARQRDRDTAPAFLQTPHIQFIAQDDEAVAIDKLRHHRIDLLLDLRAMPRYWVNELSARASSLSDCCGRARPTHPRRRNAETVSGRAVRYVDWVVPGTGDERDVPAACGASAR